MEIVVLLDRIVDIQLPKTLANFYSFSSNQDLEVLKNIRNLMDDDFQVSESFNYFSLCQMVEVFVKYFTVR